MINLPENVSVVALSHLLERSVEDIDTFIAGGEVDILIGDFNTAISILSNFSKEQKLYYDSKCDAFLGVKSDGTSVITPNTNSFIEPGGDASIVYSPEKCVQVPNIILAMLVNKLYISIGLVWNPSEVENISLNGLAKFRIKNGKRPPQVMVWSVLSTFCPSKPVSVKQTFKTWVYNLLMSKKKYDIDAEVPEVSLKELKKEVERAALLELIDFNKSLKDKEVGKDSYNITMDGLEKICRVICTRGHVGTCVSSVPDSSLYSSSDFVINDVKKKDFKVLGLSSIVPVMPNDSTDSGTLKFFLPHYEEFIRDCTQKFPGLSYEDYEESCLNGVTTYINLLFDKSRPQEGNKEFGITFAEDSCYTPSRISKKAFYIFEATNKLPLPFQAWTNTMLSSGEYFWAMLYGMLIPEHTTPRKQSLFQFSTGGCFKSHFQNILTKALKGTLEQTPKGLVFTPKTANDSVIVATALGRDHKATTSSGFSNRRQVQYSVLQLWPEAKHYNPVHPNYSKLKEELGSLQITAEEKHENATETPTNRTHFLDSNYPPHGDILSEDARVRIVETFLIDPSRYVEGVTQNQFYFDRLLMKDASLVEEATKMFERDVRSGVKVRSLAEYINEYYLPYLLLKSILSYGKYCYLNLADFGYIEEGKEHTFRPLRYEDIDRKTFCQAVFCNDKRWGSMSRDITDVMDLSTLTVSLLPVILEPAPLDCSVSELDLRDYLIGIIKPHLKGDSNDRSKRIGLVNLLKGCINRAKDCFGKGFDVRVTTKGLDERIVYGVKTIDGIVKDGEISLDAIREHCRKEITRKYLEKMEETGLSYLIADKYVNDLI